MYKFDYFVFIFSTLTLTVVPSFAISIVAVLHEVRPYKRREMISIPRMLIFWRFNIFFTV